jgi:hypothetical protein
VKRLLPLLALLALAGLVGCSDSWTVPVDPPHGPVPPQPSPVDPGPVDPNPSSGSITEAKYASVPDGATEAEVLAAIGAPFRRFTAAGMDVLQYVFVGTSGEAHFFLKDGKVERKARF